MNNHIKPSPRLAATHALNRSRSYHGLSPARRQGSLASDTPIGDAAPPSDADGELLAEEDPVHQMLKERWMKSESRIAALFSSSALREEQDPAKDGQAKTGHGPESGNADASVQPVKKAAREISDDYGDDEEDDEDEEPPHAHSPLLMKSKVGMPNGIHPPSSRSPLLTARQGQPAATAGPSQDHGNTEDARKRLEQDKIRSEEAAKRSFHTIFFTLESDRDAMLEQQKLDDLDRQMENELTDGASKPDGPAKASSAQGSLSSADLGASSLTLKNLIARIDAQRSKVRAHDAQLRQLISEVRKGRSKWANEDKVGQEELYEAAEKVLMELKAMTEYSTPFLSRVNKRDAPDYFHIIKHPMDIGTMIKKLKGLQYKSKRDFVGDLNLIWSNCLLYNGDPNHPFRKKALHMRKETDKLVPLIPDVTVRDRAEVEAEERRNHNLDNDVDGLEDSDDDQPIMASRGRKAPGKGKKGLPNAESQDNAKDDGDGVVPTTEQKPAMHSSASNLRNEFLRAESDSTGDPLLNGLSTPPPGNATPLVNGVNGHSSQGDAMDVDVVVQAQTEDIDEEDAEFRTWKQVTKKDRAAAAADRHRLFRGDALNPDEPALLRSKAGMRRWTRQQKQYIENHGASEVMSINETSQQGGSTGETLAEGIEKDSDKTLPDYYEMLTAIPGVADHLKWQDDEEGNVIVQSEEYLRLFPNNEFTSKPSKLTTKMEANMRQMQTTRKVCAKIGYVKQLQTQFQSYQNQFAKYDPQPFVEQDIPAVAVTEDGPIMAPWLCRAAFGRAVGKIFYHAGFEDFQPAALEAVTDIASDFFTKLVKSFNTYGEMPRGKVDNAPKYTAEEQVLHCLYESGLDLDSMESYMKDEMDRLGTKLGVVHERLKSHFAEIFRPALGDSAGQDGVGAFNDGSEQFVGGDFAEDIDEDFFGFRELGLLQEFGMETLSVPLHLLQNRLHNAYNSNNAASANTSNVLFDEPETYEAVSAENVTSMIGIAQDFFASRLAANNGKPLIEDEDLPIKQRFPKPRLGPAGKISSPRKRPPREQNQANKKKRKLEELARERERAGDGGAGGEGIDTASTTINEGHAKKLKDIRPLRLDLPRPDIESFGKGGAPSNDGDPEKHEANGVGDSLMDVDMSMVESHKGMADGPMSPESIVA